MAPDGSGRFGRTALAGVAVLLASAGCTDAGEGGTSPAAPAPPSPPTAAPARPAPPPPSPVDGTDVRACFDGNCVITITGPIDIPLDEATTSVSVLEITSVAPEAVEYRSGEFHGSFAPGGEVR